MNEQDIKSCIYVGQVRHRRTEPRGHEFSYRLFLMYLDLAELPTLFDGRWLWSSRRFALAWLRRGDHLDGSALPLDVAVRDRVEAQTGRRPAGPIRLLTHLRYFGHCFNPVSFFYCFDQADSRVETIIAEVNNTPWGERHCYVLSDEHNEGQGNHRRYRFNKAFHVSPFMPMDIQYDWRFSEPEQRLSVHMENWRNGQKMFDATLRLTRREITASSLAAVLARYPWMTAKVVGAIYYQALRLWLKRTPFYTHPSKEAPRQAKQA